MGSCLILVDGQSLLPKPCLPPCKIPVIQSLQTCRPAHDEFSAAVFQLRLSLLLLVLEPACPFVLGFCLEPVGVAGDTLQLLRVLLSIIVLLVELYALLDCVHVR